MREEPPSDKILFNCIENDCNLILMTGSVPHVLNRGPAGVRSLVNGL